MTHPLAEALIAVLDRVASMGDCSDTGQAFWNAYTVGARDTPQVAVSVRFTQKTRTLTAHQKLAYTEGQTSIRGLLDALTGPMDTVPSVAGAPFQWVFGVSDNGTARKLALRYGTQAIATGSTDAIAASIRRLVDLLTRLPAHNRRIFAVDGQRFPAAGPQEALALWTAIRHRGVVDADTVEETLSDLRQTPLVEIVPPTALLAHGTLGAPWMAVR